MKIKNVFNGDKLFFTSDTHFYHKKIDEFCDRGFNCDAESMNETLILSWNKKIPKDGIVFHLGDFAMTADIQKIKDIKDRLNGTIHLVLGNHDLHNRFGRQVIKDIFNNLAYDVLQIEVYDKKTDCLPRTSLESESIKLFMSHYPHLEWPRRCVHLHGHSHSNAKKQIDFNPNRYDVGIDNNNLMPISWNELKEIISYQNLNLKRL